MAAAPQLLHIPAEIKQKLEFPGVFQGRELTRKTRRLSAGIPSVDELLGGGLPRGRISEIFGHRSSGAISLAAFFASGERARMETLPVSSSRVNSIPFFVGFLENTRPATFALPLSLFILDIFVSCRPSGRSFSIRRIFS